ncbi:MAG: L-serine ammonia-lyase, iron-sulfur-dependent, subunit alpha [Candidatus Cloacimonadales bacterium]
MITKNDLLGVLKAGIAPAQGCTEPIAIALTAAYVTSVLTEKINKIDIILSHNILKNAMGVAIPGTNERGVKMAVALGAVAGLPELQLEVLRNVDDNHVAEAMQMLDRNIIKVILSTSDEIFWIEVIAHSDNHVASAIMQGSHTNLYKLSLDDKVLQKNERIDPIIQNDDLRQLMTINDIMRLVPTMTEEELSFLDEVIAKNYAIAEYGIKHNSGYGIAKSIKDYVEKGILGDGMVNYATMMTAAGSEARMSGAPLPAMANSGSGNQGITLTIPIIAVAERLKSSRLELLHALAISHLTSIHVKTYFGILSGLCGIVNAALGVSAGAVSLLGGDFKNAQAAIQNVIGDIAGMICDGAKLGCSLKVATGVRTALNCAILGMSNICVNDYEGINGADVEQSFVNLGKIVLGGMKEVDKSILAVMLEKEKY